MKTRRRFVPRAAKFADHECSNEGEPGDPIFIAKAHEIGNGQTSALNMPSLFEPNDKMSKRCKEVREEPEPDGERRYQGVVALFAEVYIEKDRLTAIAFFLRYGNPVEVELAKRNFDQYCQANDWQLGLTTKKERYEATKTALQGEIELAKARISQQCDAAEVEQATEKLNNLSAQESEIHRKKAIEREADKAKENREQAEKNREQAEVVAANEAKRLENARQCARTQEQDEKGFVTGTLTFECSASIVHKHRELSLHVEELKFKKDEPHEKNPLPAVTFCDTDEPDKEWVTDEERVTVVCRLTLPGKCAHTDCAHWTKQAVLDAIKCALVIACTSEEAEGALTYPYKCRIVIVNRNTELIYHDRLDALLVPS